jgi:hypothetical protein
MKVLVTADFYYEYELYETDDIDDLREVTRRMVNGEDVSPDETKHTLLGTHDDYWVDEAKAEADETIFITDLITTMDKEDCQHYIDNGDLETMKSLLLLAGLDNFDGTADEYDNYLNM